MDDLDRRLEDACAEDTTGEQFPGVRRMLANTRYGALALPELAQDLAERAAESAREKEDER